MTAFGKVSGRCWNAELLEQRVGAHRSPPSHSFAGAPLQTEGVDSKCTKFFYLHVTYVSGYHLSFPWFVLLTCESYVFPSLRLPTPQRCISMFLFLITHPEALRTESRFFRGALPPHSGPRLPSAVQHRQAGAPLSDSRNARFPTAPLFGGSAHGAERMGSFRDTPRTRPRKAARRVFGRDNKPFPCPRACMCVLQLWF